MQEYLLGTIIYVIILIEALDMASVAARFEMYKELKYLDVDKRNEIPAGIYSSVCFYLIPDEKFIKLTKRFPLTYFFDRKIKSILKNKTYNGENIIQRLEFIKNIKLEDIKDKQLIIDRQSIA